MNDVNQEIERLILAGAIAIAGVDDDGQLLYEFTSKMKDVNEELYNGHLNFVNAELMGLWELGFLDIDFLSDEPIVKLTEKAFLEHDISLLNKQQRWSLDEVKRLLREKEV